ncbi:MAG: hypothetical protein F6J93_02370 [Oscillatoria sp. SIO1A7]|nr:hypothetical protein [Oscillatoria sp. SIO1A7]
MDLADKLPSQSPLLLFYCSYLNKEKVETRSRFFPAIQFLARAKATASHTPSATRR